MNEKKFTDFCFLHHMFAFIKAPRIPNCSHYLPQVQYNQSTLFCTFPLQTRSFKSFKLPPFLALPICLEIKHPKKGQILCLASSS